MEGFFSAKTLLRFFAAAIVLAAVVVLVAERIENSRTPMVNAQGEVTRLVQETVLVTQLVQHVVTATPLPMPEATVTTEQTDTPISTITPEKLSVLPGGLTIWCIPKTSASDSAVIPVTGNAPEDAIMAEKVDGKTIVTTQVKSCMFTFTFNRTIESGIRLQFQDLNPDPFLDVALSPFGSLTNSGYANLNHFWIIDPPFWYVNYIVRVIDQTGETIWEETVAFKRSWQPNPCPDGRLPDPYTLACSDLSQ